MKYTVKNKHPKRTITRGGHTFKPLKEKEVNNLTENQIEQIERHWFLEIEEIEEKEDVLDGYQQISEDSGGD